MNYGEYTINYKEKGLSTLIEGTTINSFKNIYVDMKKAIYAFYLMDLVSQVLKENNDKDIYNLLVPALIKINDGLSPELISNIIEIKLLDYLGVSLNLEECSLCGHKDDLITIDINALSSADNDRPRRRSYRSCAAIKSPIRAYSLRIKTLKTMYAICISNALKTIDIAGIIGAMRITATKGRHNPRIVKNNNGNIIHNITIAI